jgi:hypothetical protein
MMETLILVRDHGRLLIQDARRRRFGSLFVPIRRSYLLVMPAILLAAGLLGFAVRSNFTMVFDAFVVSAVSIYLTYDLLGRAAPLRISTVLSLTLGLGYGVGTLNTWLTLPRSGKTLGEFLQINTPDLAEGMACILIAIALMLILGEVLEKPIFGEEFRINFENRAIVIVTLGSLFRLLTVVTGHAVGFTSQANIKQGHIGVIATISGVLEAPLLALAFCMAINAGSRFKKWYLYALTFGLFLLNFPNGRRAMIYGVVLILIAARLGRFRVSVSPFKKIAAVAIIGGILYFFTLAFYYFRVAGYTLVDPTLSERIGAVITLVKHKKDSNVDKQFSSNVEGRTFILGFLSELVGYTNSMPGGHGENIVNQFEFALPSAIYPNKNVGFSEEGLADDLFGAHYGDQANSILTAGVVDFGVFGLLLYPLLTVALFRCFMERVGEIMPSFPACFIVLLLLGTLIEPETTATSYFLALREAIMVGGGVWALSVIPRLQITGRTRL